MARVLLFAALFVLSVGVIAQSPAPAAPQQRTEWNAAAVVDFCAESVNGQAAACAFNGPLRQRRSRFGVVQANTFPIPLATILRNPAVPGQLTQFYISGGVNSSFLEWRLDDMSTLR